MADESADKKTSVCNIGTYEQGRAAIGVRGKAYGGEMEITKLTSQLYCGQLEDTNPSYWDEEFAKETWGGLIAPFGLVRTFGGAMPWKPGATAMAKSIFFQIPLPGTSVINAGTETKYFKPLKIGDRLHCHDEVTNISAEKTTKLGVGVFVTAVTSYFNQNDELVATNENNVFRFTPHK